jgi:hypothetical protein
VILANLQIVLAILHDKVPFTKWFILNDFHMGTTAFILQHMLGISLQVFVIGSMIA